MKFITYLENNKEKIGLAIEDSYYSLEKINPNLPKSVIEILSDYDANIPLFQQIEKEINIGHYVDAQIKIIEKEIYVAANEIEHRINFGLEK